MSIWPMAGGYRYFRLQPEAEAASSARLERDAGFARAIVLAAQRGADHVTCDGDGRRYIGILHKNLPELPPM